MRAESVSFVPGFSALVAERDARVPERSKVARAAKHGDRFESVLVLYSKGFLLCPAGHSIQDRFLILAICHGCLL